MGRQGEEGDHFERRRKGRGRRTEARKEQRRGKGKSASPVVTTIVTSFALDLSTKILFAQLSRFPTTHSDQVLRIALVPSDSRISCTARST